MKLKKLLACSISTVMLFSGVIASAEVEVQVDDDFGYVIATMPTQGEIEARRPDISVSATKLETQNDVKSNSNAAWSIKHKIDTYDVYKLEYTASNLGALFNGYNDAYDRAAVGIGLVKVSLPTTSLTEFYANSTSITGGTLAAATDSKFNVQWNTSSTSNPYPYFDDQNDLNKYMDDGKFTMSVVVALPIGTVLELDGITAQVAYTVDAKNTDVTLGNVQKTLTIGTVAPKAELTLEVTPETKQTNGYVWTAEVTKADAAITGFTAKFTAGEDVAERAVRNVDELNKFVGAGKTAFNIGLKTQKTLTAVEFSITDGTNTKTATPAVSK